MRRAALLLAIAAGAACGDPHPTTPPRLAERPHAPVGPPPVTKLPAPTCPLPPPLPADPDPVRPADAVDAPDERIATPAHGGRCETADSNLTRTEAAILAAHDSTAPAAAAVPAARTAGTANAPWDHKRPPAYAKLVGDRLALDAAEQAHLARDGFVVLPRFTFGSYATAFHEIYQSQLPIYVSIDAVLHAIYMGNDAAIARVEDVKLSPMIGRLLDAMACHLANPGVPMLPEQQHDLDVYLAVARSLLRGEPPQSMTGDPEVVSSATQLVADATAAQEMKIVSLFGRDRVIDFTAYTPRGHYAATPSRQRMFRAAMWLSRLEFNMVSRGSRSSQPGDVPDRSETPREAVDGLALVQLALYTDGNDLRQLDRAWSLFAGRREDIPPDEIAQLTMDGVVPTDANAAAKIRKKIGDRFQRTTRMHYMPAGVTELPAIVTLLGPRVVADAAATRPLVSDETPARTVMHAADFAYILGHDRARDYLATDRTRYPTLDGQLAKARKIMQAAPHAGDDLYSAWLDAIAGLAEVPAGARPSFMATPAFADLRIDSALAAYGQLKHNYVLMAGEPYFAGGCDIPDGYVEPAPKTYAALRDYAARGEQIMTELDPDARLGDSAYFHRLGEVLRILDEIQTDELAGKALTADERSFLSMVAEMEPGTTGQAATYTGWWFDLFRSRTVDALAGADFIASVFTGELIAYVGATSPRLGVFVIDTGGGPREVVGPVARAYEHEDEVAHRLDDAAGSTLADSARFEPWAASYTAAPGAPEPKLALIYPAQDTKHRLDAAITTASDLGPVTIELYDHHRVAIAKVTHTVKAGTTYFTLPGGKRGERGEGIHLQVGRYHKWIDRDLMEGASYAELGGSESAPAAPAPAPAPAP